MAGTCFGSVKAKVIRTTRLDTCGAPVIGSKTTVVSGGFTKIDLSPQYEDGEKFQVKGADGDYIFNDEDDPTFSRLNLTMTFSKVDVDMLEIVTGGRLIMSGGSPVGLAMPEGIIAARFAIETWTAVAGGSCSGGDPEYAYWAFPHVGGGKLGDLSFENALASFTLSGFTKKAPADTWTAGATPATTGTPYDQSYLPANEEIEEGEHYAFAITTVTPPTAACGAVALA